MPDKTINVGQTLDLTCFISDDINDVQNINDDIVVDSNVLDNSTFSESLLWTPDDDDAGETYTFEIGEKELSIKVTDVPDSDIFYKIDEEGGDTVGDSGPSEFDGTISNSDINWLTGSQYVHGAALENTGQGVVEFTTWGDFMESVVPSGCTVRVVFDSTDNDGLFVGQRDSDGNQNFYLGPEGFAGGSSGLIGFRFDDNNSNASGIYFDENYMDGRHAIAFRNTGIDDVENWDGFVDGEIKSTSVSNNTANTDNFDNFETPPTLFARNDGGNPDARHTGIIEELRIDYEVLSDSDIENWSDSVLN